MTEWAAPKPCKRGHIASRDKKGDCLACRRIREQRWRDANREKYREIKRRWRDANREASRASTRKWADKNPGRRYKNHREEHLRKHYRMSKADFIRLLIDQAGLCGLCNKPLMGTQDPVIDHIKGTKIVRSLLHNRCNSGLWGFEDIEFRELALAYLAEFEW